MAFGVILAPYGQLPNGGPPSGVLLSVGGNGSFMQPNYDQFYNTRGEPGLYTDTQLGAAKPRWIDRVRARFARRAGMAGLPTDAELSHKYGYTNVHSGWVAMNQNGQNIAWPSSWIPPNGYRAGGYPLPTSPLGGLRDDAAVGPVIDPNAPASVNDVLAALQAHNDRIFALQAVSAIAVATSALITIFRTVKLIRQEHGGSGD